MVFNVQIVNAGLAKKTDVNMGLTTLMYWSMVEAGLSPIAANLPSVCSLFSQSCIPTIDLLESSQQVYPTVVPLNGQASR